MMASAQPCLITSFFKSPPNGKETCQVSTEKSNIDDATQLDHGNPVQSDHGFAEDCDSNSSNDGLSSGSDEEESEGKPLVVNLCGLLSSEVMNGPSGGRKTVGLARKRSARHRVGSSHHREEELQPKGRTANGADPDSGASNLNAGQESSLRSEDKVCSQENSGALGNEVTCVPSDAHLTSTAPKSLSQMKQSVFSWNSKSGTLDVSVPTEPPKPSNSEELGNFKEGTDSLEEREEESLGMTEEGAGEDDTAAMVEERADVSTSKQGRKRKNSGSDGCEDGKCLQGEPRAVRCLPKQTTTGKVMPEGVVAGSEEGGLGGDDSFEDFVESIKQKRGRQKRKHPRCKTPEEEDEIDRPRTVPSQQPTECSSADGTSDGEPKPGKRPRRSAAVSANARISSSRRSRRSSEEEQRSRTKNSSVDCQQMSTESGPRNETHHSCVTLNSDLDCDLESVFHDQDVNSTPVCITLDSDHGNEPQVFEPEDKECEMDNSVIFVSSTPPTTSPIKHSSPLKPSEPISSATVTSAGLSAAWAKIFSRPNKSQTSEAVSTAIEKTVRSPVKCVKKRRTPSNSPRRHGSPSPSRSPRKGRSPRRGSPLRVRSPRKSSLLHSSPLREARCPHPASRRLAFSGSGGGGSCVVDCAPFEGVVHVQQIDPSCGLWKLGAPKSLPVVRSLSGKNVHPRLQTPIAGGLGFFSTQASAGCGDSKMPSHIRLCSEEENDRILKRLEEAHPQKDVRGIFARYTRITTPPSTGDGSQTSPERKPSSKPKKKMNTRRKNLSLKCSIRIHHDSGGTEDSKITVDTATYQKRERRSLRLAKKTQESISEDATDLGKSTQAGKTENNTQPTEPCPAASPCTTKPPAFVLDPWTKVYRPQRSSEVVGNGAQVERLRVWLSAWKSRCCSQREGEQKPPTKASNKERRDKTEGCKGSEKGEPCLQESGARHDSAVPWWVSDKDGDFLSISHLRRKRYRAPKCLDSSASGGETSGEEDDDSLCPVTLLCGPHGSGKSAAVYVCAQELGFKVFEVNSSGIRSRQTIMSTLREATLSHQVVTATHSKPAQVTGRITSFFDGSKSDPSKETKVCKGSNLPSSSGGLYSFFKPKKEARSQKDSKPTSTSSQRDTSQVARSDGACFRAELQTKTTKKRRKSQANPAIAIEDVLCPAPTEHTQSSNSVGLATATVILLDEVDILFGEDRGFWSAVYELICTTKRPIIMTCNDPRYDLECDHQKLLFSRPPVRELSLHMQLLCLSHGAHMTSEAANQIAAFLNCDIRKVMNCLQFWLSLLPGDITVEQQRLESTSNVAEVVSRGQSTQNCTGSPDSDRKEDLLLSLEHLLGFSASERQLLKRMRSRSVDPGLLCGVLETLHRNGLEVPHPLDWLRSAQAQEHAVTCTCTSSHPTCTVGSPSASVDIDTCSDLSRIQSSPSQTRPINEDSDTGSAQEIETAERSPTDHFFSAPWRCRHNLKIASKNQCLDALSNFSDTLSHMDTVAMTSCDSHLTQKPAAWWKCELETGLLDELPLSGHGDRWRAEVTRTSEGIVGVAEGLALGAWQRRMREISSYGELYDLTNQAKNQRRAEAVHSSLIKCSNVFGPHWELSHVAMATDGLPVLQLICHSENLREAAHMKRRFRHHLQASMVDLCDLKALPRTAAFLSTSHPP